MGHDMYRPQTHFKRAANFVDSLCLSDVFTALRQYGGILKTQVKSLTKGPEVTGVLL